MIPPRPMPSDPPTLPQMMPIHVPSVTDNIFKAIGYMLISFALLLFVGGIMYGLWNLTVLAYEHGWVGLIAVLLGDAVVVFILGCFAVRMSEPY